MEPAWGPFTTASAHPSFEQRSARYFPPLVSRHGSSACARKRKVALPPVSLALAGASPVSDPERMAEHRRLRETVDPFQLSQTIQARLEKVFQLSTEAVRSHKTAPTASSKLRKSSPKERTTGARAKARGEKDKTKDKRKAKRKEKRQRRVTFHVAR